MLITGRPVGADEAKAIGLADRVVPRGEARRAAEALAREIAEFPQIAMRSDRESAYFQSGLPVPAAIAAEAGFAAEARRVEARAGAGRFTDGAGRHGRFGD